MGHQYWHAYQSALLLNQVVPSPKTTACTGAATAPAPELQSVAKCG